MKSVNKDHYCNFIQTSMFFPIAHFLTKFIRSLIVAIETKNAVTVPTKMISTSCEVRVRSSIKTAFAPFKSVAPSITGAAIKNENSAAAVRETPSKDAPRIVEPEREVPGIKESTWKQPTLNAVLLFKLSTSVYL